MKFRKLFFYLLCILLSSYVFLGCDNDNSPYPNGGRDTHEQFGDRRFVILRMGYSNINKETYCLYDRKFDEQIDGNITNYKEIPPYVYTIGNAGPGERHYTTKEQKSKKSIYYTKVNYETGEVTQYLDKQSFLNEDQEIFNELETKISSYYN